MEMKSKFKLFSLILYLVSFFKSKLIKLVMVISLLFTIFSFSLNVENSYAEFDSLIDFTNNSSIDSSGIISALKSIISIVTNCLYSSVMYSFGDLNNVCIPDKIGPNIPNTCVQGNEASNFFSISNLSNLILPALIALAASAIIPGATFLMVFLCIEVIMIMEACVDSYALTPDEYINMNSGSNPLDCILDPSTNQVIVNPEAKNYLTVTDVPFFYSCKPGSTGYVGSDSQYCVTEQVANNARPNLVRNIIIRRADLWDRISGSRTQTSLCPVDSAQVILTPSISAEPATLEGPTLLPNLEVYSFYRYYSGHVQLCAATTNTLLPVVLGCTYFPAPEEEQSVDPSLVNFLKGTRCQYFLGQSNGNGRADLAAVANLIGQANGVSSVYLFLKSDLHLTSTVVGCVQDLLLRTFIDVQNAPSGSPPFMKKVQLRLQQIVFAVLTLYICILALKIMISPNPPQRGEWIIYIFKFALVLYIATGDIWYDNNSLYQGKKGNGLYPALLDTTQQIADLFMQARSASDLVDMCYYNYEGSNVLSQRVIATPTMKVQMTVWDYLDCTLINYLNFNSCKYSITGMVAMWFITTAIWAGGSGILLAIVTFIYSIMLLIVVFRFVHITILAMFTITILVLVSPLILCFFLFEYTKQITQQWAKMLLGYTLYPGLLFAFVALMLATFDSVFYGNINQEYLQQNVQCSTSGTCKIDIDKLCHNVQSIYCSLLKTTSDGSSLTNCSINNGRMTSLLTEQANFFIFGNFTVLKSVAISEFYPSVLKLLLFAVLFYFFLGSITHFIESLVGVHGLGDLAPDVGKKLASGLMSATASASTSGVSAVTGAAKALAKRFSGGGSGGDEGGGKDEGGGEDGGKK